MTDDIKVILKCISLFAVGFIVNYGMARLAAPDYHGTALAVGMFLTAFGLGFAITSMQIVMLPLGVISLVVQLLGGKKPIKRDNHKSDSLDIFGRILFVLMYAIFSTLTGAYIGYLSGGLGIFSTTVLFAVTGILLPLLVPNNMLWATEGSNDACGMDTAQRAEMEEARKNRDPSVLFVDKVAKSIIDKLVEAPPSNDRRNLP